MNQERPDEAWAKRIVEQVWGVDLTHADTHGGVDYLSPDGTVAVEVTTVTEGDRKSSKKQLERSVAKGAPTTQLQECWLVQVPDINEDMRTFVQRVHPAIAELELAGEHEFHQQRAALHAIQYGPLREIYLPLLNAGVESATSAPHAANPADPHHVHHIDVQTMRDMPASGSDNALQGLLDALVGRLDNTAKLRACGAQQRHLFVWVDFDTESAIARPLWGAAPDWADGGWGLPTAAPQIDPVVTHLWVVHQSTGQGWLWDGASWRDLTRP